MPDFIKLEHVSFSYNSHGQSIRPTLHDVNLEIEQGEFAALIGSNGSGKSTLAKLLTALLLPDSGKVIAAGLDTHDSSSQSAIRRQVGIVFQRPQDQIVATTVEEDVAFGPGNLGLPVEEVRLRVDEALEITGITSLRERPSFRLSAGETQRAALAGILAMRPKCIIFDETTAMLDPTGRMMVREQAKLLNQQGITILFITHLMQEAAGFERVIVLHEGQVLMDQPPADIFSRGEELLSIGLDLPEISKTAATLNKYFPKIPSSILDPQKLMESLPQYGGKRKEPVIHRQNTIYKNDPIITVKDLQHIYMRGSQLAHKALDGLNLQVNKGDIHCLIGITGSGKSTLLQHMNALLRPQNGSVRVGDFNLNSNDLDVKALRRRTAMAFQQPENQIFKQYVGDEIAYGPRQLGFDGKLSAIVEEAMHAVGLDFTQYKDRLTSNLSGGEQRKVALASVLALQPDILLLDEPLSGLDPQSARQLIQLLEQLSQAGRTLVISTHQYTELIDIIDRVSVINKGKDILLGSVGQVFSAFDTLQAIGLRTSLSAMIADALIEKGWPIPMEIVSLNRLDQELEKIFQKDQYGSI